MVKPSKRNNLGLAAIFILFVLGLVLLSFLVKIIFFIKETKFDGTHEFNIEVLSKNSNQIISLSPPTKSVAILYVENSGKNLSKSLGVPVDATVYSENITKDNLSSSFLKLILPFGSSFKGMNYIDALRVFLFTRGVSSNSTYQRELSSFLNSQQKSTLISLTFTDPTIYQENASIEIVNATDAYGLGSRVANVITNIGGNVILVTGAPNISKKSQIIYYGNKSYTVDRLSNIFGFPNIKTEKKSIADVIIIIGEDNKISF